eukprot:TRINITY_DN2103_c0_g1_i1.p1 TRINITY_DN2103_c0_g1~~TRINITY_DN2103_c0_g1_i1.p1  ORF type:complete len:347 (-),score=99.13 TRINITY_DN2103_c0_g1_i1:64-1104(-)
MSNFKPATVVFSLPGSSSSTKFDKPLDELIKQNGNKPADIKAKKQHNRLDLKGVVQKNVKENTKSKPARALNATKSENNPRLNKRAEDKKGRARPVFIVPPKKDEPQNKGGVKFNKPNHNTNHIDEKVKIVVKNDQFKQKETKKKEPELKERIKIRVNRTDDEMMDSDGDRDNASPQRPRHTDKKRRRSRDRSESDSDEEYRRRRPYSVNQVQPSPMYAQPQYSVPMAPAPVAAPMPPRMYGTPAGAPGAQGVFQNILHSILKQNIDERLNQTGLPPPPQPTIPMRTSYPGYSYPVAAQPVHEEPMQPLFQDNDRSGGLTLSQRFGSSSSGKSSSSGTSKITVRLH